MSWYVTVCINTMLLLLLLLLVTVLLMVLLRLLLLELPDTSRNTTAKVGEGRPRREEGRMTINNFL